MAAQGQGEFAFCLNADTGEELWRFQTDAKFSNDRGDGPRSAPTVNGARVFVLSPLGKLYALDSHSGAKLWGRDFVKEFGGGVPGWGFSSSPLVEGDLLLVEAGGAGDKSIVAFNKASGEVVWTTHADEAAYSSPIAITFNGKRQVIFLTARTLVSVAPKDGQVYWKYDWPEGINIAAPVFIPPDKIFISASYDKGAVLLKMKADGDKIGVEEMWKSRVMKNHFNSSVLHGDYLYGFDDGAFKCIKVGAGEEQWKMRGLGKGSLFYADGHFIVLSEQGKLLLVEATPTEYREKASFQLFDAKTWTVPTLAGGKLYVRNQEEMVCLDITGAH
jgi:outer membrane protein assembly factor BamB